jgi:hypothetical protein
VQVGAPVKRQFRVLVGKIANQTLRSGDQHIGVGARLASE